jgi:hypothetical protein
MYLHWIGPEWGSIYTCILDIMEKVSNTPLFVIYFSNTPLDQKVSNAPNFIRKK